MKTPNLRKSLFLPLLLASALILFLFYEMKARQATPEANNPTVSATTEQQNILAGKTMVAFGDSVTEFGHYPEIIAQDTGMIVYNLGFKGTRLAYHPHAAYDEFSPTRLVDAIVTRDFSEQETAIQEDRNYSKAFIAHYETLKTIDFNEIYLVSLFIGTNDYMGNQAGVVPIGDPADKTRVTFYGSMHYFITTLLEAYPHLELVLITPTWRMNAEESGGESATIQPNARGDYLIEFVDAIILSGQHFNLPTLDLYRTLDFSKENHADYFIDHVHPNEQGYERIGHTISQFLIETYNK